MINLQDSCRTTNSHDQVCIFLLQKNITQKGKNQITNNAKNGNKGSGGPSKDSTSTPPTDGGGFVGKQWKKYSNYLSFNEIYNLINENVHTFQSVCLFLYHLFIYDEKWDLRSWAVLSLLFEMSSTSTSSFLFISIR